MYFLHQHSHVEVHARHCRVLHAISELCRSATVAIPQDAIDVFSLALQNLNAIMECTFAMVSKAEALERVRVVEETATASLAS